MLIPVIPISEQLYTLTLNRVQHTNTFCTEAQLHSITSVFLISLPPLCIQPLSRGGWVLSQPLHLWKICPAKYICSCVENVSFLQMSVDLFWTGGQGLQTLTDIIKECAKDICYSPLNLCDILNRQNSKYLKSSYHRCCPTWNQCGGGEVCSDGRYWPVLRLSQQTVYVAGQTGGGAHCMVPQNEDCIIQSVQTILHSRLGGPEGLKSEGLGERERREEEGQSSLI